MSKGESTRKAAQRRVAVPTEYAPDPMLSCVDLGGLRELLAAGDPAAFATDSHDRVVFWNRGMGELVGRQAEDAMGHSFYDVLAGRDVFRVDSPASLPVPANPGDGGGTQARALNVTILRIAGARPDLFTRIHILEPIAEGDHLVRVLSGLTRANGGTTSSRRAAAGQPAPPLTRRETQILRLMASGLQNKEVALRLGLSPATVRNHVHSLTGKLGVHSKLEAVSVAFRNGWVAADAELSGSAQSPLGDERID
jgi:DNA-binding CsgD family transcriptional regulator